MEKARDRLRELTSTEFLSKNVTLTGYCSSYFIQAWNVDEEGVPETVEIDGIGDALRYYGSSQDITHKTLFSRLQKHITAQHERASQKNAILAERAEADAKSRRRLDLDARLRAGQITPEEYKQIVHDEFDGPADYATADTKHNARTQLERVLAKGNLTPQQYADEIMKLLNDG
jgi:hypothetical protein